MSVYTSVTFQQLQDFISDYALGHLLAFEGIQDGIANSNYAVTTSQGEFILTLFESLTVQNLAPYIQLLVYLSANYPLYPKPHADKSHQYLKSLQHKPAVICARLAGQAITTASPDQCAQTGTQLAQLHQATQRYEFKQSGRYTLTSLNASFAKVDTFLAEDDKQLIKEELAFQSRLAHSQLPEGFIHGDLFKDNVLFVDGRISGIIDFYSACYDNLLLDIAITANDWCRDNGFLNQEKLTALLTAYEQVRPLTNAEKHSLPVLLRCAALRFWLSRLIHQHRNPVGELTQIKDPAVFRQLLLQHRESCYV